MTKKRDGESADPPGLRARAEEKLRAGETREAGSPSQADAARLVHELQVHQIELEMQNEELRLSRAQAETALALYTELYDFAPVGYFTVGREGVIRKVNLAGARLVATERGRLLGQRLGAFVNEAHLPAFNAALAKAFGGGAQPSCEVELAVPKDADGARWAQLSFNRSEGEDARVVAVDVTERRQTDETLRSAQKMEAIGRLAGGVAHDFNNLFTIILAGADAALEAAEKGGSPQGDLLQVTEAARRAGALTRKLLAFGRRQLLRPRIVDVNELARGLTTLLRTALGERIELVMELAPDLGLIEVDPVQLEQVLVNLVVNAHDAMPDGGRLTLSTANVDTDSGRKERAVRPGSYVLIRVHDTGVGMDAETVAHLFEPFFTTKARRHGSGLGLASVAGTVQQCGGEIAVRSALGTGTTFDIYMPRAAASQAVVAAPQPKPAPRGGTETVLVVDDEGPLRRIAKRILESVGYTVLLAGNGAEALGVCEDCRGTIHLLVSDVVMPGMSGAQLAARVRGVRPEVRLLLMSGYTDEALGHHGVLDAGVDFIGKPFSAQGLRAKVREVLDAPVKRPSLDA